MSIQPGWYPDPAAADSLRYWSGLAWTEQTQLIPMPIPTGPPLATAMAVQDAPPQPELVAEGQAADVWLPIGMIERGALPFVCVKHGRLAAQTPRTSVYSRTPVWAYPLLFVGLLITLIVLLVIRVTATGPWPMCHECVAIRTRRKRAMWASLAVMVASIALAIALNTAWLILIAFVAIVAAIVYGALSSWSQLTQASVDRDSRTVHIQRPAMAFVQNLPR